MSFWDLFSGLVLSSLGLMLFQIGRRRSEARKIVLGIVLMGLPWLLPSGPWPWVAGALVLGLGFVG